MKNFYEKELNYIRQHHLDRFICIISKYTPYIDGGIYGIVLIMLFINKNDLLLLTIIKPLCAFLIVTLMRKFINRKRPCVTLGIDPLLDHKTDQSFPSRHTVSAFSIAFALLPINSTLACVMFILALIVAVSRILCGVHYISDVICAILISLFIYIL